MDVSRTLSLISGAVAFPLLALVTVLTILDAVSSNIHNLPLAVAAAVLDVVALGSLTLIITLVLRRNSWNKDGRRDTWRMLAVSAVCSCFAIVAAAVTLAELAVNRRHATASDTKARMTATAGVCAAAIVAQAIFYAAVVAAERSCTASDRPVEEPRPYTPTQRGRPMSLRLLTPPRALRRHDEEKTTSLRSSSATSLPTLRSSLTQSMRPATSKTRLIRTPTTERSHISHSLRSSIDSLSRVDAFDTWDTSAVDADTRDTVLSSCPRRQGTLEPIPGSRPGSPGRPLEGPFLETSPTPHGAVPAVVDPMSSPYMSRPNTSHSQRAPYIRRNDSTVSFDSVRPSSPAVSEAHIHPLFRTDSPTPAPAHSPNTVIVASPIAGQVINAPAKSFSRMNSRDTARGGNTSPLANPNAFASAPGSTGSSTPPSRAMTPPIPDVVIGGTR